MAMAEDAASVLEQFVQDVANLPAEIAHLLEEIQDKEARIQECLNIINRHDGSIQKHMRLNGIDKPHPKEDQYNVVMQKNYERAQKLQEEKITLSEKASTLLDRHVKRLDIKIRDLHADGSMINDPPLPSLLHPHGTNRGSLSSTPTGASTPLHPLNPNAGPSTTIANGPHSRLLHPLVTQQSNRVPPVHAPRPSNPLIPAHLVASNPNSPSPASTYARRESSAGAVEKKRKSIVAGQTNASGSGLKQQTITAHLNGPRASTPTTGSRAGSTGPRAARKLVNMTNIKKLPPHQAAAAARKLKSGPGKQARQKAGPATKKKGSASPPPSTADTSAATSDNEESEHESGAPPPTDVEMPDAEAEVEGDDSLYCYCKKVSSGNMIACDNPDCPTEWFHWECVGLTSEPEGSWYCDDCKKKLGK